jgi:hypothetical protein
MALRVPLFTVATTGLSVFAHVSAGGRPPGWATLALLLAVVGLLGRAMAPCEQSLPRLLGTMLWVQVAIHLALSRGGSRGAVVAVGCHTGPVTADPALPPGSTGAHHSLHGSLWMWLAHAVAALAVAAWLRRGEAASWRALRRVVARLQPRVRPLPIPHGAVTWVDQAGDARLDPPPVLLGHRWRGPPPVARARVASWLRPALMS